MVRVLTVDVFVFVLMFLRRVGVGALTMGLVACGNPPYPRGSVDELFPAGQKPDFRMVQLQDREVFVVSMASAPASASASASASVSAPKPNAPRAPVILFVHGSPGDWKAWSHFLYEPQLGNFDQRLAVDRPGFGKSEPGRIMPSLREQAATLSALIPAGRKAIVVGHSLGGPLAAWMAIDFPNKVCGAVSIAGSLSSKYEEPRWYNDLAQWRALQWAVPKEMAWSNDEMMHLSDELKQLEGNWARLQVPVILMQGGKDSLVEPRTTDEVENLAPRAWLTVKKYPEESHFLLWEKPQLVVDVIRSIRCV